MARRWSWGDIRDEPGPKPAFGRAGPRAAGCAFTSLKGLKRPRKRSEKSSVVEWLRGRFGYLYEQYSGQHNRRASVSFSTSSRRQVEDYPLTFRQPLRRLAEGCLHIEASLHSVLPHQASSLFLCAARSCWTMAKESHLKLDVVLLSLVETSYQTLDAKCILHAH
jgi:hypothetical protein